MLPVRLKVLSSSSCSLSEASSLLQRFLSGDACSDSLARDYVANVAQALQDSMSRRAGESGAALNKHRHIPSSSSHLSSPFSKELVDGRQRKEQPAPSPAHGKLYGHGKHEDGKPSLTAAADDEKTAGLAIVEAENAHKRHKKKRKHSAVETVSASVQEADGSALMHHDKKRRKEENIRTATEHIATVNSTPDTQKRRKKEKREREVEQFGMANDPLNDQQKDKSDREGEHIVTEILTPDKERHHEKKKRKDKQEAETNNIETATPTLDDRKSHEKKKRKKEKQSMGTENGETLHVNQIVSPPTSIFFDESLNMKSAVKGKKKRDAGTIGANRIIESGVSDTPLKEGSSKRKKKEEAGILVTPDNVTPKKNREKTDAEALPEAFGSFESEEKKRKKKKRKRKEEPESD